MISDLNPFLETAKQAVTEASIPILEYFHGSFEVETKSDDTPVTIADIVAGYVLLIAMPTVGFFQLGIGRGDPLSAWKKRGLWVLLVLLLPLVGIPFWGPLYLAVMFSGGAGLLAFLLAFPLLADSEP